MPLWTDEEANDNLTTCSQLINYDLEAKYNKFGYSTQYTAGGVVSSKFTNMSVLTFMQAKIQQLGLS